jgi:serine/threonine-protein kinase RsbW
VIQQLNQIGDRPHVSLLLYATSLRLASDLTALSQLLTWFEHLDQASVPAATWLQGQLLLVEGFTNAVRHAHRGISSAAGIEVEVALFADRLEIRIWDSGPAFDFDRTLKTLVASGEADLLREQGRGLLLMYRITDFLVYCRSGDDRNVLVMIKRYGWHSE